MQIRGVQGRRHVSCIVQLAELTLDVQSTITMIATTSWYPRRHHGLMGITGPDASHTCEHSQTVNSSWHLMVVVYLWSPLNAPALCLSLFCASTQKITYLSPQIAGRKTCGDGDKGKSFQTTQQCHKTGKAHPLSCVWRRRAHRDGAKVPHTCSCLPAWRIVTKAAAIKIPADHRPCFPSRIQVCTWGRVKEPVQPIFFTTPQKLRFPPPLRVALQNKVHISERRLVQRSLRDHEYQMLFMTSDGSWERHT